MRHAFELFLVFMKRSDGASAAEYALILAIISTGIAGAAVSLGDIIGSSLSSAAGCIADPNDTNC